MAASLQPIAIQELLGKDQPQRWDFDQPIARLDSVVPVQGWIELSVEGPLLRVQSEAATRIALCCDRCLRSYEHTLRVRVSETIGLGTSADDLCEALDYDAEGISEQLDPQGQFDPQQWIYEQLSLQLPLVNRCGSECPGPISWGSDEPPIDPRWAALRALKP